VEQEQREQWKIAARVGAVGIEMGLATLLGYWGGGWLDERFGSSGVFTTVGLCLGIAAGFYGLWRTAKGARPHDDDRNGTPSGK
jgi:F0F1-type ATP synthase assembly protein I